MSQIGWKVSYPLWTVLYPRVIDEQAGMENPRGDKRPRSS